AYIASREEIDRLKKSKSAEERAAAFNEFWRAKDPTPETPANEFKTEFYRRVEAANKRFTRLGRAGWRSDRGRVYILYGEPDQIDDYPLNLEGHPYQEWHYYRQGAYRKFTFVDEFDDGDYRLAFPYDGLNLRPEF
ncbi:MAG TPA: GWxTD domain-containing protein, partial [Candidatus Deferrimicrobium sp.]|nr:GWxTD domain-containing protein [Candidatus Deferrimicrobium sp.]